MESTERDDLRESLRAAERAEAAPWVDYPPTPAWYPLATGLWAAALTLSFAMESTPLRLLVVFGLVGIEIGFIHWYRRYRGTMPSGKVPAELSRPFYVFIAANLAIMAGAFLIGSLVAVWVAALFVFVTVVPWFAWYERVYDRSAARTRARLG